MRFEIDWRYLRPALIILALAALAGSGIAYLTAGYRAQMAAAYQQEMAAHEAIEQQLELTREDQALIERYLPRFTRLSAAGMLAGEQRLDWVDTLRAQTQAMKLPMVRYQINPQAPFQAPYLMEGGDVSVNVSELRLEMGLLHEVDMVHLLARLEQRVPGGFHVEGCVLQRQEQHFGYYRDHPNLSAVCRLSWFTLKAPPADEERADGA